MTQKETQTVRRSLVMVQQKDQPYFYTTIEITLCCGQLLPVSVFMGACAHCIPEPCRNSEAAVRILDIISPRL